MWKRKANEKIRKNTKVEEERGKCWTVTPVQSSRACLGEGVANKALAKPCVLLKRGEPGLLE